jgi:hypothetical protein
MKTETPRSMYTYVLVMLIASVTNVALARFAVVTRSAGPGVATIYLAVPFMVVFALWFGVWGVIAAYIGCYVGAGVLASMSHVVALYWSLADVWQVLIPLVAFRTFKANIELRTRKDLSIFLVFGLILNNLIGAGWGAATLAIGRVISWSNVIFIFGSWFATNLMVTAIITSPMLRYLTPHIRRARLRVAGYWQ